MVSLDCLISLFVLITLRNVEENKNKKDKTACLSPVLVFHYCQFVSSYCSFISDLLLAILTEKYLDIFP